ncbi:HNH endonuclease [Pseudomonas juntendi]|uniref:HNH endonuclease n=1 Tax=Pseudomonas juntendi TaxID=2666183 RepID=A0A7W2KBP0_9PSED|nr:HNH endonuclease [Pseudomonas juntendi]MBA6095583.1 HNH endonuclease [Pseudomonas juntendi]
MGRVKIPSAVKHALRSEVGFGCPVRGCGNPYLEYHHFDPPYREKAHNDPNGMIALCAHHHDKADGGVFTVDQLREMKCDRANAESVKGSLDWLRRNMVALVGGSFYYETPRVVVIDDVEVVSVRRDEEGYLRLSVNLLSLEADERICIDMNSWSGIGEPIDLRCPPQGKELEVSYENGDYIYLRFSEFSCPGDAYEKYRNKGFLDEKNVAYPITVLEVNLRIGGANIVLTPQASKFDWITLSPSTVIRCGTGIKVSLGLPWKNLKK